MLTPSDGGRRLYLHVGLPKTGTTFLQGVLADNASRMRDAGVLYPLAYREAMFHAAVDLRESYERWGLRADRVAGTWKRLASAVQQHSGTSIVSHEILSSAGPEQVAAAYDDLRGTDVHIVLTTRDLSRQLSAYWQESIKNGGTSPFDEFLGRIRSDLEVGKLRSAFWRSQNPIGVLRRWAGKLPPQNVHVVVAPPPGADRLELWRRFAAAVGLDPDAYSVEDVRPSNESLGAAQSSLLRDVNEALDDRLVRPPYTYVVKRFFAQNVLAQQKSPRPAVPPDMLELVRGQSQRWTQEISSAGYTVHGELHELVAPSGSADHAPQAVVPYQERYDAATAAIAELLLEISRLREASITPLGSAYGGLRPLVRRILDRMR